MARRTCTVAVGGLLLIGAGSANGSTQIATNPAGDQVLFHQVLGQTSRPLYAATRHPGGGFGALRPVVPPPGRFVPTAAVDDGGGFAVAWTSYDPHYQSHPATNSVATGSPD